MKPFVTRMVIDLHLAAVFLTRLPLPRLPDDTPPLARTMWAFPIVGAVAGLIAGAVLGVADDLGLPKLAAVLAALAAGVLVTGALHEDGLADVADGFGGGHTRERKLEILRDSRIGSYGVLALIFAVGLKAAALLALPTVDAAVAALVLAGAFSRAVLPLVMRLVPPARADGLGASAGSSEGLVIPAAFAIAALLAWLLAPGFVVGLIGLTVAVGLLAAYLAWRQVGGFTGDVLGAAAVATEVVVLLVLAGAAA